MDKALFIELLKRCRELRKLGTGFGIYIKVDLAALQYGWVCACAAMSKLSEPK